MGFIWVPREANRVAHAFAKATAVRPSPSTWSSNLPFDLKNLILSEARSSERNV
ncbi:hypothetical protein PIB30_076846, partial [Stylosanthes scabra]|nr:hypothetical protein [Stylosanthes scabra]